MRHKFAEIQATKPGDFGAFAADAIYVLITQPCHSGRQLLDQSEAGSQETRNRIDPELGREDAQTLQEAITIGDMVPAPAILCFVL